MPYKDPEKQRESNRRVAKKWYHNNKDVSRQRNLSTNRTRICKERGITVAQYWAMHEAQDGKCAICAAPEADDRILSIDHCHATNVVRGLLCQPCNMALGLLKENAGRIAAAARYVADPPGVPDDGQAVLDIAC